MANSREITRKLTDAASAATKAINSAGTPQSLHHAAAAYESIAAAISNIDERLVKLENSAEQGRE